MKRIILALLLLAAPVAHAGLASLTDVTNIVMELASTNVNVVVVSNTVLAMNVLTNGFPNNGNGTILLGGNVITNPLATYNGVLSGFANSIEGDEGGGPSIPGCEASVIVGGEFNSIIDAEYSFIGGGRLNNITADNSGAGGSGASFIGGGYDNQIIGIPHSYIGGGVGNVAGFYPPPGGGLFGSSGSTIGGGNWNASTNDGTTVSGGEGNVAGGVGSYVGGGGGNQSLGYTSVVSGGLSNITDVTGLWSVIGGGEGNFASNSFSSVCGGQYNTANGQWSFIGGGLSNSASGEFSSIAGGGYKDNASGGFSTINGGQNNTASGFASTVMGGSGNIAQGSFSIASGYYSTATYNGSCVWGDQNSREQDTAPNQWRASYHGGFFFDNGPMNGYGYFTNSAGNPLIDAITSSNIAYQVGLGMAGPTNGVTAPTVTNIVQVYGGSLFQSLNTNLTSWSSVSPVQFQPANTNLTNWANLGTNQFAPTNLASATKSGILFSNDWSAFNGKQNALTYQPATNAAPILLTQLPYIPQPASTNLTNWSSIGTNQFARTNLSSSTSSGILSSNDWQTFWGRQFQLTYQPATNGGPVAYSQLPFVPQTNQYIAGSGVTLTTNSGVVTITSTVGGGTTTIFTNVLNNSTLSYSNAISNAKSVTFEFLCVTNDSNTGYLVGDFVGIGSVEESVGSYSYSLTTWRNIGYVGISLNTKVFVGQEAYWNLNKKGGSSATYPTTWLNFKLITTVQQ